MKLKPEKSQLKRAVIVIENSTKRFRNGRKTEKAGSIKIKCFN